jgi:hypothetical protein
LKPVEKVEGFRLLSLHLEREGRPRRAALVHGYRRGGILRGVGQMFTVAITGVCRAVQV